jgi:hypothetical protein
MAKERIAAGAKSGSKYRTLTAEIDLTLTLNYRFTDRNNSEAPHTTLPRIISPEDGGSKEPGHRA